MNEITQQIIDITQKEKELRKAIKIGKPWSMDNKVLDFFRKCNTCPLRPMVREMPKPDGSIVKIPMPAKCHVYEKDSDCKIPKETHINKLNFYYNVGEQLDNISLQKAIIYGVLEDAELAKEAELVEKRAPGFYTARFKEIAMKGLSDLNKIENEKPQNHLHLHNKESSGDVMEDIYNKAFFEEQPVKIVKEVKQEKEEDGADNTQESNN